MVKKRFFLENLISKFTNAQTIISSQGKKDNMILREKNDHYP